MELEDFIHILSLHSRVVFGQVFIFVQLLSSREACAQCARNCAAMRLVVYGMQCALQCAAVWQCGSVRQQCGSVRQCERQCVAVRTVVYVCGSLQQRTW
jgi:hypothetical protein